MSKYELLKNYLFIFMKGFQTIWKKKWLFLLPMGIHLLSFKKSPLPVTQGTSAFIQIPGSLSLNYYGAIPALCIVLPLGLLILNIYFTRYKKYEEKQILKFLFPYIILLTLGCIGITTEDFFSSYFMKPWIIILSSKVLVIILVSTILAIDTFITIILYNGIKNELFDEKMGWIEIISYTISRFFPLFLFELFLGLIIFYLIDIITLVFGHNYLLMYVLLYILSMFIFLFLMFVPFSIVFEKIGVISAIRRNLEIWKSSYKTIIIFILLANIITFPFQLIIIMIKNAHLNILFTESASLIGIFIQMIIMSSLIFLYFGIPKKDVY